MESTRYCLFRAEIPAIPNKERDVSWMPLAIQKAPLISRLLYMLIRTSVLVIVGVSTIMAKRICFAAHNKPDPQRRVFLISPDFTLKEILSN